LALIEIGLEEKIGAYQLGLYFLIEHSMDSLPLFYFDFYGAWIDGVLFA
jgi:hypothetical protein